MIPLIALDLSLDGIVVMSRAPEGPDRGKWWREGVVRLDADEMSEQLRHMRDRCAARVGEGFTTVLVIPDTQILFTSLERDDRDAKVTIRALLRGRTPYPIEDLTFDFVQRGDRLQVAVVALETLLEAESFAAGFGFRPVALVGNPRDSTYPGMPDFGPTGIAADLLAGARLTLDLDEGFTVVPAPAPPRKPQPEEVQTAAASHTGAAPQETPDAAGEAPAYRAPPAEVRVTEPDPAIILPELTAPRVPPVPPLPPKSVFPPGTPLPANAARPRVEPMAPPPAAPQDLQPEPPAPAADTAETPADFASVLSSTSDAIPAADPVPAPDAPRAGADRPAPTVPGPAAGPTGDDPVFARRTNPARPDASAAPAFVTRRRAPVVDAPRSEPGLMRITPRLSQPAPDGSDAAPVLSAPKRPAALDGLPPVAPGPAPTEPPAAGPAAGTVPDSASGPPAARATRPALLSALAGKAGLAATGLGRVAGRARSLGPARKRASAPADDRVGDDRVETDGNPDMALAGHDGGGLPKARAASRRFGLFLTLSLLALLAAIALWSVAVTGDDVAGRTGSDPAATAGLLPPPVAPGDGTGTGTSIADLPPSAQSTDPTRPTDDADLALLLPDSQGSPAARPGAPPEATPEELVESGEADADTAADVMPEIAVVTTDAEPFELPREMAAAPQTGTAEEIYLASIDPVIENGDAVALPRAQVPVDAFSPQTSPAPAGTDFNTGSDGLVIASAAGTLAPGGYSVIAGRPATLPAPRPGETAAQQATQTAESDAARAELVRMRPVRRPDDAPERVERLNFNGFTRAELTRSRPVQRPAEITEAAARAEAAATRQAAAVQAAASAAVASLAQTDAPAGVPETETATSASRYALALSGRPRERPRSVEQDAARIVTQRRAQAPAAATSTASLPAAADSGGQTVRSAGGSVARAATQSNQIRLREVNLIGVYGRPNSRRALVRLSNGRYVKVEVGDRLERGRVTAIGESEVIYQQNGRNYALRMPQT